MKNNFEVIKFLYPKVLLGSSPIFEIKFNFITFSLVDKTNKILIYYTIYLLVMNYEDVVRYLFISNLLYFFYF